MPPFAACLLFELHEFDGKYFVKIFYRDDEKKDARLLCESSLDDFYVSNRDIIPIGGYKEECDLKI